MPAIYSPQWYEALKELLNRNPEVRKNAPPGTYNVLAEIRGDQQSLYLTAGERRNFVIRFDDGQCADYRELDAPPPRKGFDFIFEVPASIFEGIAAGVIDLVDAGLRGRIKVTGDMRILIRHAELVNAVYAVYAKEIETLWPKGKPAKTAGGAPKDGGRQSG
jgi:putative sterol carrier protein